MCLRFKFCTHQRVCVINFLKKVKFVVPYCTQTTLRHIYIASMHSYIFSRDAEVSFLSKLIQQYCASSAKVCCESIGGKKEWIIRKYKTYTVSQSKFLLNSCFLSLPLIFNPSCPFRFTPDWYLKYINCFLNKLHNFNNHWSALTCVKTFQNIE